MVSSKQPQPEPWAAPDAGYKWWDPSTFKPGSYGYGTTSGGGSGGSDTYEPNDSQSAAYGPISSGTTYNGYIGTSTDADWFKFTTGASGSISVSLSSLPGVYDLYLYNSSGSLLASSEQSGTTAESISYTASAASTCYVKVVGYNGAMSTTQAYALKTTYPTSSTSAPYALVHQAQLPNHATFQVNIVVNGMTANSTVSGYDIGVYNSTGTQEAKTQNADGTWPTSYGYSSTFSLSADASGHAEKIVSMQINPTFSGAANMRLRLNSTGKYTESVTVADVPAEPLP